MDFIDKKDIPLFQGSEQTGQIARFVENRTGCNFQIDTEFRSNDMRQRGFSQTGRAVKEHVVEGLATQHRSLDKDLEILEHLVLPGELFETLRPDHLVEIAFLVALFRTGIECVSHPSQTLSTTQN